MRNLHFREFCILLRDNTCSIKILLFSKALLMYIPHAKMLRPQAGHVTGDRLWRMPLYGQYTKQIQDRVADISNVGARGRYATKFALC